MFLGPSGTRCLRVVASAENREGEAAVDSPKTHLITWFYKDSFGDRVPTGGIPMVLDMALSVAPRGKIGLALRQGQDLAKDWILDALGQPTTELADLAAGLGVPIGAHKGYGLALAMEVLAGVMSGAGYASEHSRENLKEAKANIGHFFLVMKPELFLPRSQFEARLGDLFEQVRTSERAQGTAEILIPGELELRTRAESMRLGVPVRESVYRTLLEAAESTRAFS